MKADLIVINARLGNVDPCRPQALGNFMGQAGIGRQAGGYLPAQSVLQELVLLLVFGVHGWIPFAFSALLRAWTAREQCVLTLPSEQPMAAAVSATSMSSQ